MQIALGRTVVARPLTAFKTVADIIEWPQIIRSISSVELLPPSPVRAGTRLREQRIMFGHETIEEIMIAEIERPRRLRLVAEKREINYESLWAQAPALCWCSGLDPERRLVARCSPHLAHHGDQVA
jgi:hypothetical protein